MGKLNDKDLDQTIRSYRVEIDRLEKGKPLVELYRELEEKLRIDRPEQDRVQRA